MTYRIICIKPTNTDWLTPRSSDAVQITGPVSKNSTDIYDDEEAAAKEDGNDGFEIPCSAHLTWGDRSIDLECRYYPSFSLFTDVGECADKTADMADEADRVKSVSLTMQDAIFSEKKREHDEIVNDEDMRDDHGNPFLVLHVNRGVCGSTRLYCKKVTDSQNCLMDGVGDLGMIQSAEEIGDETDVVRQGNQKMIL